MADEANPGSRGLASALSGPIEAGDLEAALEAARAAQLADPGDIAARRVVEALELLLAQVWYGGQPDGEPDAEGSPFAGAATSLRDGQLTEALSVYAGSTARQWDPERSHRLAHRVQVVIAAADGAPLPPEESSSPSGPRPALKHEMPTRAAKRAEMPLDQLVAMDEVEGELAHPTIRDHLGEAEPAPHEAFDDISRSSRAGLRETTRVAGEGELPLEELRREMEQDRLRESSDAALDGLLEELDEETTGLDIEVDIDLDSGDELGHPKPQTPSKTFRRPRPEELEVVEEELEVIEEELSAAADYGSEPPPRGPSSPPIPSRDELSADPIHAPLDTRELAIPERRGWDVREGGAEEAIGPDPTTSWSGVPIYEEDPATFEPGEVTADEDRWDVPTDVKSKGGRREREAETLVARGELERALAIYEELAAASPEETRLWRRIKAIAWMLQRDIDPTET